MKKILLGTVALAALGLAQASAADLAPRYTKAAPMMAAVYDWTGFYIGANGGGGWGRDRFSTTGGSVGINTSGGFAGGQIGYNWQTGAWVLGLEADGDWADIKGTTGCAAGLFVCSSDARALASFRGRVGYAVNNVLFYGTGGAGYANVHNTALSLAAGVPAVGATGAFNSDRWGYAAGAGIEWGFSPNWSAKVEYMHYGLGSETAPAGTLNPALNVTSRVDIDTVKVGVNYRWGGPVIARY
ncbi:MAG: porin family protein [Proteobacteria bacterium]|nr:porin family protein [Pseudomonadota bacterium]